MNSKPRDISPAAAIARLTGERDLARSESRVLERLIDVLVDERARLIERLATRKEGEPLRPVVPVSEFVANPQGALDLVARRGGVVVVNERGEVCAVLSRPPEGEKPPPR
jgi:hypothetical protein